MGVMSKPHSFLVASGLASAASAIIPIEMAAIATSAGSANGGKYAAVVFVLVSLATAISTPFIPLWAQRWGYSRVLRDAMSLRSALFVCIGLAAIIGDFDYLMIFIASPLIGVLIAIRMSCTPLLGRAILSPDSPVMWSRRQRVRAPAAALGAVIGGLLVSSEAISGFGLMLGGLMSIPLALVAASTNADHITPPVMNRRRYNLFTELKAMWGQVPIRVGCCVAVVGSFVLTPLHTMIVPILAELDRDRLWQGAGLILASLQLGSMGTKFVLNKLRRIRQVSNGQIATSAMAVSGALMFSFTVATSSRLGSLELVMWILISGGVALFRGVVNATQVGVFIDDANRTEDANGIAALNFIRTTSTTIALLIWGVLIDEVGSEFLLAGAGLLAVAAGAILMPMIRRSTIATTE